MKPDETSDQPEQWPWLDEQRLAHEHPMIFHYTRSEHLPRILDSKGLFATRYDATNDPDELHSLRHPLATLMAMSAMPVLKYAESLGNFRPPADIDLEAMALDEAVGFHDIMVRALPKPLPCLTCFCTHKADHHVRNGLLTMWRLYGGGDGIALGFDTQHLVMRSGEIQRANAVAGIYLERVLYGLGDPELLRRVMESPDVIRKFAETLSLMLQGKEDIGSTASTTLLRFLRLICSSKHPDFSDEREVRLVVQEALPGREFGRPRLDQASEQRLVVPYLESLRQVMVGPSDSQEALVSAARNLLDEAGRSDVSVTTSQIKFRFI